MTSLSEDKLKDGDQVQDLSYPDSNCAVTIVAPIRVLEQVLAPNLPSVSPTTCLLSRNPSHSRRLARMQ